MKPLSTLVNLICCSTLCYLVVAGWAGQPCLAQDTVGPEIPIGQISGTTMMRDEFRARAYAQLTAIAVNAHAYWVVHGDYPENFATLRGSDAWVVDAKNMFTPRAVQSIEFKPTPKDLTTDASLGLYEAFAATPAYRPGTPRTGSVNDFIQGIPGALGEALSNQTATGSIPRVSPSKITRYTPGDVFYYAKAGMLQLIMYAPDGTFVELVSEVPRPGWLERLRLSPKSEYFPQGVYAAGLLYFTGELLPQYYSLMLFMCDRDTPVLSKLGQGGPEEYMALAAELDLELRNFTSKQPIEVAPEAEPGDFAPYATDGESELRLWWRDATTVSLAQLMQDVPAVDNTQPPPPGKPEAKKPAAKKPGGAPPMGGRRE